MITEEIQMKINVLWMTDREAILQLAQRLKSNIGQVAWRLTRSNEGAIDKEAIAEILTQLYAHAGDLEKLVKQTLKGTPRAGQISTAFKPSTGLSPNFHRPEMIVL